MYEMLIAALNLIRHDLDVGFEFTFRQPCHDGRNLTGPTVPSGLNSCVWRERYASKPRRIKLFETFQWTWTWTHDLTDSARELEVLSIEGYSINWLDVQRPHTTLQGWLKLCTLRLQDILKDGGTVIGILSAHEKTLTHVDFGRIQLRGGTWDAPISNQARMRRLKNLRLDQLVQPASSSYPIRRTL